MKILSKSILFFLAVSMVCCLPVICMAKPDATTKYSVVREANPKGEKETLILPYAFPSDSMGTTAGVGGLAKGYGQEQLLFAGSVFASADDAKGFVGGMWDYRLPWTERFFFSAFGMVANFPNQRAYAEVPKRPSSSEPPPAGSNDSDEDNYIEDDGDDNWLELKLEYVLPMGAMRDKGMAEYRLKNGILKSGATGGEVWNPMESGVSVLLLGQMSRYQSYNTDDFTYDGDTFPFRFGYLYNNTDFVVNPSKGSLQYLGYSQDFSDDNDVSNWNFLEFETSKYFDLGASNRARQRVVALNLWTGTSLSWNETTNENGEVVVEDHPPFFEGANLGGFYRMRGYPSDRFNDRSVLYTTAEYRHTLKWNPVAGVNWLRWLKLDWFQLVGFVEGGRVAGDYDDELLKDWKVDGGIGIRAMTAGAVVRLDVAVSEEGTNAWVMFGHPF